MLKELSHFIRHLPEVMGMKRRMRQAELYQALMERSEAAGLGERRASLVADLRGDVLEIGCGSGLMFRHYARGARVTAVEPDGSFLRLARNQAAGVALVRANGEDLPFPDGRFDAAVLAMVLCSVRSVEQVLREVRRVLKPGAPLRLIEHVRSERLVAGLLMDLANPLWRRMNGQGCNMNRRPVEALRAAGFDVAGVEPFEVFAAGVPAYPKRLIRALRRR